MGFDSSKEIDLKIGVVFSSWSHFGQNPFPRRTINHKHEHHYKVLEVRLKPLFLSVQTFCLKMPRSFLGEFDHGKL